MRYFSRLFTTSLFVGLSFILVASLSAKGQDPTNRPLISRIDPQPIVASARAQAIKIEGTGFAEHTRLTFRYRGTGSKVEVFENQPISYFDPTFLVVAGVFERPEGIWSVEAVNEQATSGEFVFQVTGSHATEDAQPNVVESAPDLSIQPNTITCSTTPPAFVVNDYPFPSKPYCNSTPCPPSTVDPYHFYYRECTSFVAFRMNKDHGTPSSPFWFMDSMTNGSYYAIWGNAGNWRNAAAALHFTVDTTPRVGSIAQWTAAEIGSVGHVAYVEQVNTNGTIWISEYNSRGDHTYCSRQITSAPRYIHVNDPGGSSFTITASPLTKTLTRGQSAQFTVSLKSTNGYHSPVLLTVVNPPPSNAGLTWNPPEVVPNVNGNANSVLTLSTNSMTSTGPFVMTLRASNGQVSQDATVTLIITANTQPPAVTTGSASAITNSSATLGGNVNPNGASTQYWFLYGINSNLSGASRTPNYGVGSGTTSVSISANVSALAANTKYYYQLVASNSAGTSYGSILSFNTPIPASFSTSPASGLQAATSFSFDGAGLTPYDTIQQWWQGPTGGAINGGTLTADASGRIHWNHTYKCSDMPGMWWTWIVDVSRGWTSAHVSNSVSANSSCTAPSITSIVPNPVPVSSGVSVDIYGTNFQTGGHLHFTWTISGGGYRDRSDYTFLSSSHVQIRINTCCVASNGWTVQMVNPNSQVSNAFSFSTH